MRQEGSVPGSRFAGINWIPSSQGRDPCLEIHFSATNFVWADIPVAHTLPLGNALNKAANNGVKCLGVCQVNLIK